MDKHSISWKAREFSNKKRSTDWYWTFWSISFFIAFLFFYFGDTTSALLVVVAAFSINISLGTKNTLKAYTIDTEGISENNKKIIFDEIESYNIDKDDKKIILKLRSKYAFLKKIPLGRITQVEKLDEFLQKRLKEDKDLRSSFLEILIEKLISF